MSKACTRAPSRRAVAIAWSPATPAPMISTRDGAMVPAAVISIGSSLLDAVAASSTARYPATVACDDSTSIDWALVVRGTSSSAIADTPARARDCSRSGERSGSMSPTTVAPRGSAAITSLEGGRTVVSTSLARAAAATAVSASCAPASRYASSGKNDACPAPTSAPPSPPRPRTFRPVPGTSAHRGVGELRARFQVRLNGKKRRVPRPHLHDHFGPEVAELAHRLGDERHTRFPRHALLDYGDLHWIQSAMKMLVSPSFAAPRF